MLNADMTENAPVLRWYGERGIVNAAMSYVAAAPDERLPTLLSAVKWAEGNGPSWLPGTRNPTLFVEWGLADFGNPDLFIVLHASDGPACVFVEAKVGQYLSSMMSNTLGMREAGFNSSINGQLALKFRFVTALGSCENTAVEIVEPDGVLKQYRQRLNDPRQAPRRLAKAGIVDVFRESGLLGIREDRCAYVALTWDTASRMFCNDPFVAAEDGLPRFLKADGRDVYAEVRPRLGWLGYRELHDALGLAHQPAFRAAFETMLLTLEPTPDDYAVAERAFAETISPESVAEAASFKGLFRGYEIVQRAGSYSVQEHGQTIAKIIPRRDKVFVGIRDSKQPELWFKSAALERVSVKGVPFFGLWVPVDHPNDAQLAEFVEGLPPGGAREKANRADKPRNGTSEGGI
jgi:hypothetical protein